ncbi:hypothetical protein F5887DRAFT_1084289 [Amanita rubescens]|nr:hypothetical protein F5887DRAFT_1084289 [Amanita rubescens]
MSLLAPEATFIKAYDDWTKTAQCMSILIRERPDCDWTENHGFFAWMGGFQLVKEDGSTKQLRKLELFQSILSGEIDIPKIRLEEIMDRSKGDEIAKAIALIQAIWFAMQAINRAAQHLPITALEITTLAHVSLNVLIYWCWWNKPLNIRFPVDVYPKKTDGTDLAIDEVRTGGDTGAEVRDHDGPMEGGTSDKEESQKIRPRLSVRIKIGAYLGDMTGSWMIRVVVGIPYCAITAIFGAIHCIAWNLDFATHLESKLWRISSIIVTVMPSIFVLSVMVSAKIYDGLLPKSSLVAHGLMLFTMVPVYFFGRVCLLVLSLLALRSLPENAYLIPSWTIYVPHIG